MKEHYLIKFTTNSGQIFTEEIFGRNLLVDLLNFCVKEVKITVTYL
jgi:hypothetical protein